MVQEALNYLSKDRLLHIDMLEPIQLRTAEVLHAGEEGVLLYHAHSGAYMISGVCEDIVKSLYKKIPSSEKVQMVVLHQPFCEQEIAEQFQLTGHMPCHQAAYLAKTPLPIPTGNIRVQPLAETNLPFVVKHYTHIADVEYIRSRLRAGMLGAYVGGELAGFVGVHSEGTIGMLEVLPAFRRLGIAYVLEASLINRFLEDEKVPYCQVEKSNEASLALQRKLGMTVTEEASIVWLF